MLKQKQIEEMRDFNRKYTQVLGVFDRRIFGTDLSWAEARILIEIGINHLKTPMMLSRQLSLDKSYVSRILNKLVKKGVLVKKPSPEDSRSVQLSFTPAGLKILDRINDQSNDLVSNLIQDLPVAEQEEFFRCISRANQLLFEKRG